MVYTLKGPKPKAGTTSAEVHLFSTVMEYKIPSPIITEFVCVCTLICIDH